MTKLWLLLYWVTRICLDHVDGKSTCNELDVIFLIDTRWFNDQNDQKRVTNFIDTIIQSGSNEQSGFGITLYGDHIATDQAIDVVKATDSANILNRDEKANYVQTPLLELFAKLDIRRPQSMDGGKASRVSMATAFDHADAIYDDSDRDREYFVFYDTESEEANDFCHLVEQNHALDTSKFHFILNGDYEFIPTQCVPTLSVNMFSSAHNLKQITMDSSKMERIFDEITCNSYFAEGDIKLSNHVQWIDPNTVQSCVIDVPRPYITVYDEPRDGNTFKKDDFLLAHKNTISALPETCNKHLVYKILDIESVKNARAPIAKVLKLYVALVESPREYIRQIRVERDNIPIPVRKNSRKLQSDCSFDLANLIPDFSLDFEIGFSGCPTGLSLSKHVNFHYDHQESFAYNAFPVDISCAAEIDLSVEVEFDLCLKLYFKFDWDVATEEMHLEYYLYGEWGYAIGLLAEATAQCVIYTTPLSYSRTFYPVIGVIPVVITPYVNMDVTITLPQLSGQAGLDIEHRETFKSGYKYKKELVGWEPHYDLVRSDTDYDKMDTVKTWTGTIANSLKKCVLLNAAKGKNSNGIPKCLWFQYNSKTNTCRCKGNSPMNLNRKTTVSTSGNCNAYILMYKCGSLNKKCGWSGGWGGEIINPCGVSTGLNLDINIKQSGSKNCACVDRPWPLTGSECLAKKQFCKSCSANPGGDTVLDVTADGPIKESAVIQDDVTPILKYGGDCSQDLSITFEVELEIGSLLYFVWRSYVTLTMTFTFRFMLPEMDSPALCGYGSNFDMCNLDNLEASYGIPINWRARFGAKPELSIKALLGKILDELEGINLFDDCDLGLPDYITGWANEADDALGLDVFAANLDLSVQFGSGNINTFTGCFALSDAADDFFRPKCCTGGAHQNQLVKQLEVDYEDNGDEFRGYTAMQRSVFVGVIAMIAFTACITIYNCRACYRLRQQERKCETVDVEQYPLVQ